MNDTVRRRDGLWQLDTPAGLALMFTLGLLLRVLLAPVLGFDGDLALFATQARELTERGPRHFFVAGEFQDYPPGYLYILWLTGKPLLVMIGALTLLALALVPRAAALRRRTAADDRPRQPVEADTGRP